MSGDADLDGPSAAAYEKYWDAVAGGDGPSAVEVALQLRDSGTALGDVLDQLVSRAQREVGARWAANDWDVAREHRATSIGEEVVAALTVGIDTPPDGRAAIITCADGEWHALPSRILAAVLREAGWTVTFLGASVPARHLTQLVHDIGPDVVALSCALPLRLRQARQVIELARGAGIPVLIGGRGFGPDGRWGLALGASGWAADARAALAALAVPAFVDPAPPLPAPDDASDRLLAAREQIVAACMDQLAELGRPDVAAYDADQLARTREDFGYIVDFAAAALYVDDAYLFEQFVTWLDGLLVARGVPSQTLAAGLDLVARLAPRWAGAAPRRDAVLAAGRAAVGAVGVVGAVGA